MPLDARAQRAGALAVHDAHLVHAGHHGLVQVFFHLDQRFIQRHAAHVAFHAHGAAGGLGVHQHGGFLLFWLLFLHQAELGQVGLQLHDAGLQLHIALGVWLG